MNPTDINNPEYFHGVIDCQLACPAHTPVPEYIRLIAHGRFTDAYMINWRSNVFPGILGRTCDRPCEPACRRGRVEDEPLVDSRKEPVAICRLKRVAADYKDDVGDRLPKAPASTMRSTVSTPILSISSRAPAYSAALASWMARTSFWTIEISGDSR